MPRAGLNAELVIAAAAERVDERGLSQLEMAEVAQRLGVRPPSLYKHLQGLPELRLGIATLAARDLEAALRSAVRQDEQKEPLRAVSRAFRDYVRAHPGRYAAIVELQPHAPANGPFLLALERTLESFAAALVDYPIAAADRTHALRMLRSTLHGFSTIESSGGFRHAAGVEASFDWLLVLLESGLRALGADRNAAQAPAGASANGSSAGAP